MLIEPCIDHFPAGLIYGLLHVEQLVDDVASLVFRTGDEGRSFRAYLLTHVDSRAGVDRR